MKVEQNNKVEFTELDEKKSSLFVGLRQQIRQCDINDDELHNAIKFLHEPDLFNNVIQEIKKQGVAGEFNTIATIFLCSANLWVLNPVQKTHVMINSSSSSGKDYVTKCVFNVFPEGIKDFRTKISAEVFTYWRTDKKSRDDGFSWDGRLLYLEDCNQTLLNSATFRIMLSGGSKSTVIREQRAIEMSIPGRPLVLITTATTKPSNELLNRFLPVSLDESNEQTINIFKQQALMVSGRYERYDCSQMQKTLALLSRVRVIVPFSDVIDSIFPQKPVSMRRDYSRFLTLIQNSACLYQFQRERDENDNVIATWDDYDNAVFCFGGIQQNSVKLTRSQQKVYDSLEADQWYFINEVSVRTCLERSWVLQLLHQLMEKELVDCKLDESEAVTKAKCLYRKVSVLSSLPRSELVRSALKIVEGHSLLRHDDKK